MFDALFFSSPPSSVLISDFVRHVHDLHKDSGYKFSAEYEVCLWTLFVCCEVVGNFLREALCGIVVRDLLTNSIS